MAKMYGTQFFHSNIPYEIRPFLLALYKHLAIRFFSYRGPQSSSVREMRVNTQEEFNANSPLREKC